MKKFAAPGYLIHFYSLYIRASRDAISIIDTPMPPRRDLLAHIACVFRNGRRERLEGGRSSNADDRSAVHREREAGGFGEKDSAADRPNDPW